MWCLENMTVLNNFKRLNELTLLTYEELVLESEAVINLFAVNLDLPKVDAMNKLINKPSNSSQYSQIATNTAIEKNDKQYLLEKWKHEINESDIESVENILNHFNIDIYKADSIYPDPFYTKFLNRDIELKN